jgi:hypothetical protein
MRLIAVVLFASVLLSGATFAQEHFTRWTHAGGQLTFEHPSGWNVNEMRSQTEGALRIMVGAANFECQIWRLPRPQTASISPDEVRQRYLRALAVDKWTDLVAPLSEFRDAPAAWDITVDTTLVWPTQHAIVRSGEHEARVSIQGRPGFELISLCQSFDTQDRSAVFDRITASVDAPQ